MINPEFIGFIAGGLSASVFVPQIMKIIKEKSAEELSLLTCVIGAVSGGLWLWYGIINNHISMIVTNIVGVLAGLLLVVLKVVFNGNAAKS